MDWQPMAALPDQPADDNSKVFRALFWGRLLVKGMDQEWWTDWKVLKVSWVYWLGDRVNGSAKIAENWWYESSPPCRTMKVDATHWMPLPPPPSSENPRQ